MPTEKELKDKETNLKQQLKVSQKAIEKALKDKSTRTAKTQITKFRGQLNDIEVIVISRLSKLEGQPTYEKESDEWVELSNDLEDKYATYQEDYALLDNVVAVDPAKVARIRALHDSLKTRLTASRKLVDDIVKAASEENKETPLSRAKYHHYTNSLEELRKEVQTDLKLTLKELSTLDPEKQGDYKALYDEESTYFSGQRFIALSSISALEQEAPVAQSSTNNSINQGDSAFNSEEFAETLARGLSNATFNPTDSSSTSTKSAKYKYKLEDVPTLKEDVKDYPWFRDEWHKCVMPGQSDAMVLRMLQKYTPESDDMSIFETPDQAWSYLDKKYANSVAVSARLIEEFIKDKSLVGKNDDQKLMYLHNKVMKLYSRLKAVGQDSQLTHNIYVMNQAFHRFFGFGFL